MSAGLYGYDYMLDKKEGEKGRRKRKQLCNSKFKKRS